MKKYIKSASAKRHSFHKKKSLFSDLLLMGKKSLKIRKMCFK